MVHHDGGKKNTKIQFTHNRNCELVTNYSLTRAWFWDTNILVIFVFIIEFLILFINYVEHNLLKHNSATEETYRVSRLRFGTWKVSNKYKVKHVWLYLYWFLMFRKDLKMLTVFRLFFLIILKVLIGEVNCIFLKKGYVWGSLWTFSFMYNIFWNHFYSQWVPFQQRWGK